MKVLKSALIGVVALAALGGLWFFLGRTEEKGSGDTHQTADVAQPRRNVSKARKHVRRFKDEFVAEWQKTHEKPDILLDSEEAAGLTELEKEILKALRDALDNNDFSSVCKVLELMKKSGSLAVGSKGHWSSGVNKFLRQSAVDALGWFGSGALPELTEFFGDADEEVARSAIDQFELAMQDVTMADYERAEVVKLAAKLITDKSDLDWVLSEAINARPSVGVETLLDISHNGTAEAKEMIPTYVELFTGYDNLITEDDICTWLEEHPDPSDAEEFWGPHPLN